MQILTFTVVQSARRGDGKVGLVLIQSTSFSLQVHVDERGWDSVVVVKFLRDYLVRRRIF